MTELDLGRALRLATYAMQLALGAITAYAVLQVSAGMLANAGLPFLIALFPLYVRYRYDNQLSPVLSLWIVTAAFLHAVGMLGLYRTFGWYDQIAHGVSGAVVAGVGYALVRVIENEYDSVEIPPNLRFVFIVVFAGALGVIWEVAEFTLSELAVVFGGKPLLAQFGLGDVVLDMLFSIAGAVLVAIWGTRYFDGLRSVVDRHVDGTGERAADRDDSADRPAD
ncbi:hypothetical protein OB920_14600 [Halobacteria archaeon HArc-gm2]|nr:hypothetical protein [Halobacteria archaeon HArc-gm2]